MAILTTEHDFVLPKGLIDASGQLHRAGTMRLATARDELEPLKDRRVSGPEDPYLTILVLARVITRLGTLDRLTAADVERLFAADIAHLQDVYAAINYGTAEEIARVTAVTDRPGAPAPLATAPGVEPHATAGTAAPLPEAVGEDEDRIEVLDEEPLPAVSPPHRGSGRRARIEEIGRSSGRPGRA